MEKTISTNQASLILCIFTIALKLSALPAIMFFYTGNDSYVACAIALAFDFIGTLIIVNIMKKNPDKSFNQIITDSLGKVVTIIIQVLLLLYFLTKCVLVLQELHDYFIATLFEELNPVFYLIVMILLMLFSATKDFRTVGRLIQLIFWPVLIGIVFTLIFPVNDLQIVKLLPIFEQGFRPIFVGLSRTTFAFGDYMILLPMMGHITFHQKTKKHILLFMSSTLSFILNFFIIFIGSFGDFSIAQTLALSELPLHNTTPATIGKLEWLTLTIWTIILLINAIILIIACRSTFDTIFNSFGKKIGAIVTSLTVGIAVTLTYLQLEAIVEFAISPAFASIIGLFQVAIILVLIIASGINNKSRTNTKQKHEIQEKMRC